MPYKHSRYTHRRVINPRRCQRGSFRTIDPGRRGHTKVIICRLKGKGRTTTQSILKEKRPRKKNLLHSFLK